MFAPVLWFSQLFGFDETVQAVYDKFVALECPDGVYIASRVNGRRFRAGHFALRNQSSFHSLTPFGGGKLNMIHGAGSSGKTYLVDALEAQAQPDMDGATILAASNFNCLEFVSSSQTAASGVTNYVYDHTQGPYVALGAGASTVFRNYFVRHESGRVGQIDEEVRLLKDTALDEMVRHGYPIVRQADVEELGKWNWDDMTQYLVGVHQNCQVTTTRCESSFCEVEEGRMIHQVYAAALNFNGDVVDTPVTREIAKKLLAAEYRLAVLAAWENSIKYPERAGSKKLSLTLLGGGVFGNEKSAIVEAINSCEDVIVQSGLDVYVVCYSDSDFQSVFAGLKSLMESTGGRVINAS